MQQQKLILVVDDFELNRDLYVFLLSEKGFRVTVASDGQQALDQAFKLRPDLILMDLSLPVISGAEAAARLKADKRTRNIPIIIITAYDLPNATSALGCEAVLTKPCMPDKMLAEIVRVFEKYGKAERREPPATGIARSVSG